MSELKLLELLKVRDREFCKAVQSYGVDAWVEHFAPDGVMVNAEGFIVRGHDAIRHYMVPVFSTPGFSLTWEPIDGAVSECGDMGYTYGDYVRKYLNEDGRMEEVTGRYTTIWRKQSNGLWLIELDTGN